MRKSNKTKLKIIKAVDGKFWITKLGPDYDDQGPYQSKAEALEDVPGLERFIESQNESQHKCNFQKNSEN